MFANEQEGRRHAVPIDQVFSLKRLFAAQFLEPTTSGANAQIESGRRSTLDTRRILRHIWHIIRRLADGCRSYADRAVERNSSSADRSRTERMNMLMGTYPDSGIRGYSVDYGRLAAEFDMRLPRGAMQDQPVYSRDEQVMQAPDGLSRTPVTEPGRFSRPMRWSSDMSTHDLDRAWAAINAIGGDWHSSEWDAGADWALDRALLAIEELGGKDPLARQAQGHSGAIPTPRRARLRVSDQSNGFDASDIPD